MRILFLMAFLFPFFLHARYNPLVHFSYEPKYKKYTFKDWNKIGVRLTKDVLHGESEREIDEKINIARNLLARIAKMNLAKEQADVVRPYLINFLKEYLEDEEFIRIIKSEAFIKEFNAPSQLRLPIYRSYWYLPRCLIATIASLSPTQKETDLCVELVKKVPNDGLSKRYFYDIINLILILSKDNTVAKYLYTADSLKIFSEIKFSKDRDDAWKILLKDFYDRLKTNDTGGFIYESRIRYMEKYKDFCDGLPFPLYSETKSESGKYYLAIQITGLLKTGVERELITKAKLSEEYRKLKVINDELLSTKHPEDEFKEYLRDENYELIERIEERYHGLRALYEWEGKTRQSMDNEISVLIDKMLSSRQLAADPAYENLKKNYSLYIPDYINRNREKYMKPGLPLPLEYLLGEIASTESFGILLDNYMLNPNLRTATSLAACTGRADITMLFRALSKNDLLDEFLKTLLPDEWEKIKSQNLEQKENHYSGNYSRIRNSARKKALPILE